MLFIMFLNSTERGIREIKDEPKRTAKALHWLVPQSR
jgi:uncharacterized protein with GYD domain